MKNIIYTIPVFFFFLSCSFTETDTPESQLAGEAVYRDTRTASAAIMNCYAQMREKGIFTGNPDGMSNLLGNYADELDHYGLAESAAQDFHAHSIVSTNSTVLSWWNDTYNLIYNANALFEGVTRSASITAPDRDRLLGEALFVRALCHFYLANLFGDIPYITTTDYTANTITSRQPVNTVYGKITTDLLEAQRLIPDAYTNNQKVRPNKATATALLARVYLYAHNWQQAAECASVVIGNAAYQLEPNPAKPFLRGASSTIWQLHPGTTGSNTFEARTFIITETPPTISALSPHVLDAFGPGDLRRDNWVSSIEGESGTFYYPYKYKQRGLTTTSQEYTIMLRLPEQYLIRAEARAKMGDMPGAQSDLNTIRNLYGLENTTAETIPGLLSAILHERRIEFFTEFGHRWFDLKRTGNAATLSAIKPGWTSNDVLFPIPEMEMIVNPNLRPQNPGY